MNTISFLGTVELSAPPHVMQGQIAIDARLKVECSLFQLQISL
jgi:hypothetical protein